MTAKKILFTLILIFLFAGCSNKEYVVDIKKPYNINDQLEIKDTKNIYIKEKEISKLEFNEKEKEFFNILKNDSYASLCASKDKFIQIENSINNKERKNLLEELFYEYANNLVNSCIDINSLKKQLEKKEYKDKKQFYEIYTKSLNKEELYKQYNSSTISIKDILTKYTPKHPDFFKFIKALDKNKLNKLDYKKLRLNIERLKLLKNYDASNFIQLNIPSYNFSLYENGINVKSFGTVVGSVEDQTPILSSKLSYFIVNPTWNIPDSIAKKSIIPKALKDKNYLRKKNIVIRKNYKLDSEKIKFKNVKWKQYLKDDVKYIPYKFIQLPSSTNGMGRIKYMFKNDYAVYMHDTMGTWRFKSNKEKIRFVSHGCVRLEHPISLMKYISEKYTNKSYSAVRKIYDSSQTASISLNKKLPLHITYITSYIKNGEVKFYNDPYGYDKIQKLNF